MSYKAFLFLESFRNFMPKEQKLVNVFGYVCFTNKTT